jgi:DNA-directed RNA polymerase specialized sigma24 family protein
LPNRRQSAVVASKNPERVGAQTDPADLEVLGERSAVQSRIVELRYFGGLSIEQTASVLHISTGSVKREWRVARAWLYQQMNSE